MDSTLDSPLNWFSEGERTVIKISIGSAKPSVSKNSDSSIGSPCFKT